MPPLYILQQNTKLRIRNRRLQVERDPAGGEPAGQPETLLSVPLAQVTQVVLFGNIGLTTPAIDALLAQESDVTFLTARGEYRGRLVGPVTPHVPLRRAQYTCLGKPDFVLAMAGGFVRSKLQHQRALLQRHQRENPDPLVGDAIGQLAEALESLPRKVAVSSLMGLEGSATAAYFRALRSFFAPEWHFEDRNRRPPADPVNVLLSFGYTLLAQAAAGAVEAVGLDPYAGFLHEVAYNRPALALDLMEEFRPVIDGLVLWVCRGGQITTADFTPGPPERPVILGEEGQRRFLRAYEERMDSSFTHPIANVKLPLRSCLIEHARQLASRLQNGLPGYQGMGFR